MADVYGNSYLTIAATMAANARIGIFRSPSPVPPTIEVDAIDSDGKAFSIYAREALQHMKTPDDHPLLLRAWTLQEHLLPTRILQFDQDEIIWECNARRWCCCLLDDNPITKRRTVKTGLSKLLREGKPEQYIQQWTDLSENRKSLLAVRHNWQAVTHNYMDRSLTMLEDRLTALGGVARRVGAITKSRYLAGLWENDIVPGLLWHCINHGTSRIRGDYRAPSWSWASVEAAISDHSHLMPQDRDAFDITVIEAYCTPSTVDPFGAVSDGFIKMRGRLAAGKFEYHGDRYSTDYIVRDGVEQHFSKDEKRVSPKLDYLYEGNTLHCLLIWRTEQEHYKSRSDFHCYMLVLRECASRYHGCRSFERIGMVTQGLLETKPWFDGAEFEEGFLV